jgi:BlaI family penicillinase repressor
MSIANGAIDGAPPPLGELEAEVMRLLWQHGSGSAEVVRAWVERPLKESTIRTVLRRLEQKGYVSHMVEGRTYVYAPSSPADEIAARSVRGLAELLYRGSVADLVVGLMGKTRLAPKELDRLAELIAQARKKAK